jgi:hypothetical protein
MIITTRAGGVTYGYIRPAKSNFLAFSEILASLGNILQIVLVY